MCKIVEFKTREQRFSDWLKEVFHKNELPQQKDIKSALFLWKTETKDTETILHARYDSDIEELEEFRNALNELIFQRKMTLFLQNNIGNFIEYIE